MGEVNAAYRLPGAACAGTSSASGTLFSGALGRLLAAVPGIAGLDATLPTLLLPPPLLLKAAVAACNIEFLAESGAELAFRAFLIKVWAASRDELPSVKAEVLASLLPAASMTPANAALQAQIIVLPYHLCKYI